SSTTSSPRSATPPRRREAHRFVGELPRDAQPPPQIRCRPCESRDPKPLSVVAVASWGGQHARQPWSVVVGPGSALALARLSGTTVSLLSRFGIRCIAAISLWRWSPLRRRRRYGGMIVRILPGMLH